MAETPSAAGLASGLPDSFQDARSTSDGHGPAEPGLRRGTRENTVSS
jgi:hypothetical protein